VLQIFLEVTKYKVNLKGVILFISAHCFWTPRLES